MSIPTYKRLDGFRKAKRSGLGLVRNILSFPLLPYMLGFALLLDCNTLPGSLGRFSTLLNVSIPLLVVLIILLAWLVVPISFRVLQTALLWVVAIAVAYGIVVFANKEWSTSSFLALANLALFPLMLYLLRQIGLLDNYARSFVNCAVILAAISLVLWMAGPVMGVISTNCSIENNWTYVDRASYNYGYYHLQYVVQTQNFLGISIVRNTGLFVEAPMYSYALCCALIVERLFRDNSRMLVTIILMITVGTTFASTGVICILGLILIDALRFARSKSGSTRTLLTLLFVIVFLFCAAIAFSVFDQKMNTRSGNIRLDDFIAGFEAWIQSPITGYGLNHSDVVQRYMSAFRSNNMGFSNSLMNILVMGGAVLLIPFVVAFAGFLKQSAHMKLAGLLYAFLWTITIVTFLNLSMFILAFGVMGFLGGICEEDFAASDGTT